MRSCPRGDYLAYLFGGSLGRRDEFVLYVRMVAHMIRRAGREVPLPPFALPSLALVDAWARGDGSASACTRAAAALQSHTDQPLVFALWLLLFQPERCERGDQGSGSGWWREAAPVREVALALTRRSEPEARRPSPESLAWTADVFREVIKLH